VEDWIARFLSLKPYFVRGGIRCFVQGIRIVVRRAFGKQSWEPKKSRQTAPPWPIAKEQLKPPYIRLCSSLIVLASLTAPVRSNLSTILLFAHFAVLESSGYPLAVSRSFYFDLEAARQGSASVFPSELGPSMICGDDSFSFLDPFLTLRRPQPPLDSLPPFLPRVCASESHGIIVVAFSHQESALVRRTVPNNKGDKLLKVASRAKRISSVESTEVLGTTC